MGRDTDILDRLLEKPCYIMDVLPRQVERDAEGSFFDVEDYLLNGGRRFGQRENTYGLPSRGNERAGHKKASYTMMIMD